MAAFQGWVSSSINNVCEKIALKNHMYTPEKEPVKMVLKSKTISRIIKTDRFYGCL